MSITPGEAPISANEDQIIADIIQANLKMMEVEENGFKWRAQHPKGHGAIPARFIVGPDVPQAHRVGLFAQPGEYAALIRFSTYTLILIGLLALALVPAVILGLTVPNSAPEACKEEAQLQHGAWVVVGLFILMAVGLLGLALFVRGLQMALFPIGEEMAYNFVRKGNLWWLLIFAFALGFGTTVAEPALIAISEEAARIAASGQVIVVMTHPAPRAVLAGRTLALPVDVDPSCWRSRVSAPSGNRVYSWRWKDR